MGCGSGLVKYLLFLFNLIFALAGLALLALGVYHIVENSKTSGVYDNAAIESAPILVTVIGAIVFVIAFFGCCGAIKESTCMLTFYGIILISIFLIQIAIGVFAIVTVKEDDNKTFKTEIRKAVQKTKNAYYNDPGAEQSFNLLQQGLKCCGVDGPNDWTTLPRSCCENNPENCYRANAFNEGCANKLYEVLRKNIETVGYVALGLCVTEIVAAIFAFCLSSSIKNERRRGFA